MNLIKAIPLIASGFAFGFANQGLAQTAMAKPAQKIEAATLDHEFGFSAGSVVVAPIPFNNPLIGAGLAIGAGYLFQADEDSNTSVLGLGALHSDNGTTAYGLSGSLAWDHNTWQLSATIAEADLNYDLYVLGLPVPLNQKGILFSGELLYGVTPDLSFGGKLRYLDTTISSGNSSALPISVSPDADLETVNLSFLARWDTRENTLYPVQGHILDFELMAGEVLNSASTRQYGKAVLNFSAYRQVHEKTVVAARVTTCAASTDSPFFDLCSLGGTDAFRGFSSMQYLGPRSLSAQIEVRQNLSERFRAVAFAGAGMTGQEFTSLNAGGVHVAGGLGMRFKLSKKFDADFSIDFSHNDEGENLTYIYVGQRF
ncbi:BamA/TamA family outer membrane protein [Shimia thalassica]|uniref:BamA/TamA family outer membrane protein n=1 Tax=Shimia thalassica TaxID=1715693 RepID=UPI002737129C|nr:BamA/TamA family outer membrane protein [Shimia thalassica]MDP2580386.1 BamA/TamA family outer membrane protein [Shimia thalassica]